MRKIAPAIAAFLVGSSGGALAEETPAEPKRKDAPDYPVSCEPADGAAPENHSVDVAFSINRDGLTENVSVISSTDSCFEETALSAVRGWIYEPRRVNGRAETQTGMHARLAFSYEEGEPSNVFDAQPIKRDAPAFPERCEVGAADNETVGVEYDVSETGDTENIRIVETTNDCFNKASIAAVEKWKFRPKMVDGEPRRRLGFRSLLNFELRENTPPESFMRRITSRRLSLVRLYLKDGETETAAKTLENFEARYGDSLSRKELAEFHRIRAYVRIKQKDYVGALDDFRTVKRLDPGNSRAAVEKRIVQLEDYLGYGPGEGNAAPEQDASEKQGVP